jgi:hypothetical protein
MYDNCSICTEPIKPGNNKNGILTNCKHSFHRKCLTKWATNASQNAHGLFAFLNRNPSCPNCRRMSIRNTLVDDIIQHQKKLDDAIKLFEEAFMITRYSGKYTNKISAILKFPESVKPVKTFESMASFLIHVITNKNVANDPNMKHFKNTFLSVIQAHKKFVYVFTGSFGIPDDNNEFSNLQLNAINTSFKGISKLKVNRLIRYMKDENEVLMLIDLIKDQMACAFQNVVDMSDNKNKNNRNFLRNIHEKLFIPIANNAGDYTHRLYNNLKTNH